MLSPADQQESRTTISRTAPQAAAYAVKATTRALTDFAKKKPLGAIGGVVFLIMLLLIPIGPAVAPFDPYSPHGKFKYAGPGAVCNSETACRENIGKTFWLGADQLGRDTLSRLLHGAKTSIRVAVISVLVGVTAGALIGMASAYFGGIIDLVVQRLLDTLMSIPVIILALAIVAAFGASITNVILALIVIFITGSGRVIRAQAMSVRETDYVLAATAVGAGPVRIILRHIAPNCAAPYIVFATANIGYAIVVEAALSFLGVGPPPDDPTWGGMLSVAGNNFIEVSPWLLLFPGLVICMAVFSVNLLGDALRDVLDPRLRGTS